MITKHNIALACYPLALQIFIRFASKICKLQKGTLQKKIVGRALSDFCSTLTYRDATKTQQEPSAFQLW